jgi:hypothetical protein
VNASVQQSSQEITAAALQPTAACLLLHVVALQALGISTAAAQRILDSNAGGTPSFIPQGNLRQMLAQSPSLPVQFPKFIHRYPLLQNTHEVSSCWRYNSRFCLGIHNPIVVVNSYSKGTCITPAICNKQASGCNVQGLSAPTVTLSSCCCCAGAVG